jgi:hypothetical protein
VVVVKLIVATASTECYDDRKRLSASACTANTLLVVKSHGRHIRQEDSLQTADVNANLHRCCNAENIDFVDLGNKLPRLT